MTEMTDAVTTTIRTAPAANPQSPDHSRGQAQSRTGRGSLTICGLGFHQGHLTLETVTTIVRAEKLLYGGNGAGTWLRELNPSAEDVDIYRADGTARSRVVAFYGSASTAVYPAAVAYRRAKAEGYEAR